MEMEKSSDLASYMILRLSRSDFKEDNMRDDELKLSAMLCSKSILRYCDLRFDGEHVKTSYAVTVA